MTNNCNKSAVFVWYCVCVWSGVCGWVCLCCSSTRPSKPCILNVFFQFLGPSCPPPSLAFGTIVAFHLSSLQTPYGTLSPAFTHPLLLCSICHQLSQDFTRWSLLASQYVPDRSVMSICKVLGRAKCWGLTTALPPGKPCQRIGLARHTPGWSPESNELE